MRFHWALMSGVLLVAQVSQASITGSSGSALADVTGDRRADFITVTPYGLKVNVSNGGTFLGTASWTTDPYYGSRGTWFADVTGDGRAEALAINECGSNCVIVSMRRSNGYEFLPNESSYAVNAPSTASFDFADVNGDGRADFIQVPRDGRQGVLVSLSVGAGFDFPVAWTDIPYHGTYGTWFADVTGDGKADAIVSNEGELVVRRSDGTRFLPNEKWSWSSYSGTKGTWFEDVTGDGKADAIVENADAVVVRRSNGSGFLPNEVWSGPLASNTQSWFGDLTGDGKTDLVYRAGITTCYSWPGHPWPQTYCTYTFRWYLAYSNGTAFGQPFVWQ
ncbi:MAG TPA: VCBS repeat-containing protein [Archangium sp.]|uniref:FG-GAP repeat domain-containing protein n=1 Tax=Archangium sp. TaxID=1872627 RepID=UPI002E362BA3|nr:VCBS repeat-containing protein [Archangium sp.]HEX5747382.1 VCBS repeat-containing protein [Archangium sp.]